MEALRPVSDAEGTGEDDPRRLVLGSPQAIDPRWVTVQRLGNLVSTLIFAAILGAIVLTIYWRDDVPAQYQTPAALAAAALFVVRAIIGQLWPALAWKPSVSVANSGFVHSW